MRKTAIWAGLETLYFTGTHRLARNFLSGAGAILTFHHVLPQRDDSFQPNRGLAITPEFFDEVLTSLAHADVDVVSMEEAAQRLTDRAPGRRFVALTFDDGYRDTLNHAWPILKRHDMPVTLYVASAFADGTGTLWWELLEKAVARGLPIEIVLDGERRRFDCDTAQAKNDTYDTLYAWLRAREHEADLVKAIDEIAAACDIDAQAQCRELCMDWNTLAGLAADPLVTIGSHTVSHPFLSKLDATGARAEMVDSRRRIGEKLGVRADHFAYPVGGPDAAGPREFALAAEAGYRTAVTTRAGVLFPEHRNYLTALPRISVNGEFQRLRYLDVLLSGAATALMNGFRRVDAA